MRRIELLVKQVRRATENEDIAGISTDEFVQYLNDAQDRLQTVIYNKHPESQVFAAQGFIDTVAGTDTYSIETLKDNNGVSATSRIFAKNSVIAVEIKDQGTSYSPMRFISDRERGSGYGYFLRAGSVIISPEPNSSISDGVRVIFNQKIDNLDIRRGTITSLSPLTVNTSTVPTGTDFDVDYLSIVDGDGVVKVREIENGGYASGTGVITTTTDVSAAAIGDYVLYGKHSTTHCSLPDICERYLLAYCELKIFMRDSSADGSAQAQLVKEMEQEIIELFADNVDDAMVVPIMDTDYLLW